MKESEKDRFINMVAHSIHNAQVAVSGAILDSAISTLENHNLSHDAIESMLDSIQVKAMELREDFEYKIEEMVDDHIKTENKEVN